jgi:hypothetical protein
MEIRSSLKKTGPFFTETLQCTCGGGGAASRSTSFTIYSPPPAVWKGFNFFHPNTTFGPCTCRAYILRFFDLDSGRSHSGRMAYACECAGHPRRKVFQDKEDAAATTKAMANCWGFHVGSMPSGTKGDPKKNQSAKIFERERFFRLGSRSVGGHVGPVLTKRCGPLCSFF